LFQEKEIIACEGGVFLEWDKQLVLRDIEKGNMCAYYTVCPVS
jgi:hypothetical protein